MLPMRRAFLLGGAVALVAAPAAAQSATAASDTSITYFDGIPDVHTDFYADGQLLAKAVAPGATSQTFVVKPGIHNLAVFRAGADPDSATPLVSTRKTVAAGSRTTIAGYLDTSGKKEMKTLTNPSSATVKPRLVVWHLADAGTADVMVNGKPVLQNLRNGVFVSATLPTGKATVRAVKAGTKTPASTAATVDLRAKATTVVIVWGAGDSIKATQAKASSKAVPIKVPAGEGEPPPSRWSAYGLLTGGLGALGATMWMLRRRAV